MERTEAHKGDQCTNLVGRPRRLGFGPANGWAALSKHFGVTWARPRREEWPYRGSRGRHTSWRQHSAQGSAAPKSRQGHIAKFGSTRKHAAHSTAEQSKAVYHNDGGGQPHHPPQAPAPAQHPTPSVGARPTTGNAPTHSHRRPQTGRTRKNQRQAPGARTWPRQWVGGPVQALRRLPELGPHGRSGPAWVAAAAAPHRGSVAHNAAAA